MADLRTAELKLARPEPDSGPRPSPGQSGHFDSSEPLATVWQRAKTALVTRVVGPRQLVTAPRLVIPIGHNQLAFRVSSHAPEADELAHDGRVLVQPGDWRGNPNLGSHQWQGRAQVVTRGTLLPFVQSEIDAKYRWRIPLARFAHRMARGSAPYGDVIVLVTIHESRPALTP